MATATELAFVLALSLVPGLTSLDEGSERIRSPRMMHSAWMTVLPPRIMFVVPMICDLRETLLPVSWKGERDC